MRHQTVLVGLVVVAALSPRATQGLEEPYCLTHDPHPYVKFATKTAYSLARGQLTHEDIVPKGCEASQIWHLVRHGTRYPSHGVTEAFLKQLPALQADVLLAHKHGRGELCDSDLRLLEDWSLGGLNLTWSSLLASKGGEELKGLALRYKAALPLLLDQPFSNDSFKFRHTATQRTEESAQAYAKGLFGDDVYMPAPLEPDPLLRFYDVCDKYLTEVDNNPAATVESQLFQEGPEMAAVVDSASSRLGVPLSLQQVEIVYDACRFYKAWDPSSTSAWCTAFAPSDLKVMEDWLDLKKYYTDGYGHAINYEMACPPLQDLIQHFSDVVDGRGGPDGLFYFTHSRALLTVMARFGLYQDTSPLTHHHLDPDRLWRTSSHGIFATNLAFVLSSCGQERWWVSVAMSERVVSLAGCSSSSPGCSWEEFTNAYGRYRSCDFDNVCLNDAAKELPSAGNSAEVAWVVGVMRVLKALTSWAGHLFI